MSKLTILETKSFKVGQRKVTVRRQDIADSSKPHQVQVSATAKGVKMTQTTSYGPRAVGNADGDYAWFDQDKADTLVAQMLRFLDTKKGKTLVGKEPTNA
jgi:hypothetical protein